MCSSSSYQPLLAQVLGVGGGTPVAATAGGFDITKFTAGFMKNIAIVFDPIFRAVNFTDRCGAVASLAQMAKDGR